jgi:hypothetical protein
MPSPVDEAIRTIASRPCDNDHLGGCRSLEKHLGPTMEQCPSCIAKRALGRLNSNPNLAVGRGCQDKRFYSTPERATTAATQRSKASGVNLRVYGCQACGGYHLTKQSLEEFAGV